jgi:hypothetical protein
MYAVYEQGLSLKAVAEQFGLSSKTRVGEIFTAAGLKVRTHYELDFRVFARLTSS